MASDISLAVGDGARRMTYAELADIRRISVASAMRLVRRKNWPRQTGNDGVVRILVPLSAASDREERRAQFRGEAVADKRNVRRRQPRTSDRTSAPDIRRTIETLESAIATLSGQLDIAQSALTAERDRAERSDRRIDELLHQLADGSERGPGTDPMTAIGIQTLSQAIEMLREDVDRERDRADRSERQIEDGCKRVDDLLIELADARTAAMRAVPRRRRCAPSSRC